MSLGHSVQIALQVEVGTAVEELQMMVGSALGGIPFGKRSHICIIRYSQCITFNIVLKLSIHHALENEINGNSHHEKL